MNPASDWYKDQFDPGWREREAERARKFKEAFAPCQKQIPCGECHLQSAERCDICNASHDR